MGPIHEGFTPSSVQFSCSVMSDSLRPREPQQTSRSITNSQSLPKSMSIESMMPSNHHILCRPLLLLPSIFPSIRVFSNESALRIRWPKYWSFSFNISPFNEHPQLISFRMDWLDLLAVQGTLKSLLQHHSSKASILRLSAVFIVQLSHPYTTTGKTIGLTRRTFKVMSLSKHFPKPPPPKTITSGIKISNWEVGGTKIRTITSPPNLIKFYSTFSQRKKNIVFLLYSSTNEWDNPLGFPGGSDSKESACNAGDLGSVPGLEKSPVEGNNTPLQCSYLENSIDKGAWGP